MQKNQTVSLLIIALSFIGTVVGAGFATGQEILKFFTVFGKPGFFGILLSGALICYFSWLIMHLSRQIRAENHYALLTYIAGERIGRLIDSLLTISFIGVLVVMTAGSGAVFSELFDLPPVIGSLILLLLTFFTVVSGLEYVIKAISAVVPLMLIAVLSVSLFTVFNNTIDLFSIKLPALSMATSKGWIVSSSLYVSYNMILALAILSSLGTLASNRLAAALGSILGTLGLVISILAINLALVSTLTYSAGQQVPMLYLASRIHFIVSWAYGLIILLEIYTTAVSILYGFTSRLSTGKISRAVYSLSACVIAFLLSRHGFSETVIMYYPIIGWAGFFFLFCLAKKHLQIIINKSQE